MMDNVSCMSFGTLEAVHSFFLFVEVIYVHVVVVPILVIVIVFVVVQEFI
jgi:hypothetical protein